MELAYTKSTWMERTAVALLIAVFLLLASYRIDAIGPYFDEWIFVPVSLRTLRACDIEAAVGRAWGCLPLMQAPPYVGVVKAWLMAPVFLLFGVSVESVRWPPILLTAFTLLLLFRFARAQWGRVVALSLLALFATDIAMIAQARFDWGPFVVSNLCKVLVVVGALAWAERGDRRWLVVACAAACIGFVDKLNFVWMIIATFGAIWVSHRRELITRLRDSSRSERIVLTITTLLMLYIANELVRPAMKMNLAGFEQATTLSAHAEWVITLYHHTFSGVGVHNWMFREERPSGLWPAWLLLGQMLATLPLLWFSRKQPAAAMQRRLLVFLTCVLVLLCVQMLATRQVGGSHHLIMFWPFPWLHLAALCGLAALVSNGRLLRHAASAVLGVVIAMAMLSNFQGHRAYADALRVPGNTRPYFDPTLLELARRIDREQGGLVISADWGLHHGLLSLASPDSRRRYIDWSGAISQDPATDRERTDWLRANFLREPTALLVEYDEATAVHTPNQIAAYLAQWRACIAKRTQVADAAGRPLYVLTEIRSDPAACATATAPP